MKGAVLTREDAAAMVQRMHGSVHDMTEKAHGQPFFELRLDSASLEIGYHGHGIGFHGTEQRVCVAHLSGVTADYGPDDKAIVRREERRVRSLARYLASVPGDRVAAARALAEAA